MRRDWHCGPVYQTTLLSNFSNVNTAQQGCTAVVGGGTFMKEAVTTINDEPQGNLANNGAEPESNCEHITYFCSNGFRTVPRTDEHKCSDCGDVVDTNVPSCNCCCHLEECNCCFFCKSVPCHCPQTTLLSLTSVGIQLLSPEAFGLIMTKELTQVAIDLQKLRLCYTPGNTPNIWTINALRSQSQNSAKAETLRSFVLALPGALDYSLPLNSFLRARLVQFCDAVIVLELNFFVKMLHPNVQLEQGWTPFGIQPCCDRARLDASKRLTSIVCAVATWSDARVLFMDLGNFIKLSSVSKHWYKALEPSRSAFKKMELTQRRMSLGLFPEVLQDKLLKAGAMSSVSFWDEVELPSIDYEYTEDPSVEFAQWGAMEYSENDLLSVPLHWCHHFGKFPRALTRAEMDLAPGQAKNPDSASYLPGDIENAMPADRPLPAEGQGLDISQPNTDKTGSCSLTSLGKRKLCRKFGNTGECRPGHPAQPTDKLSWLVDTPELAVNADWLSVDASKAPRAQLQLLSANIYTSPSSHDYCRGSNHRQARYGHRGDAHIGEASHPGPKRTTPMDPPDHVEKWACGTCTYLNDAFVKVCEVCSNVKRIRCTDTDTAPTSAPMSVVASRTNVTRPRSIKTRASPTSAEAAQCQFLYGRD